MNKRIFIVNGMARCGKDTFARYLDDYIPVYKCSSIEYIKYVAAQCGWMGGKEEKDRKFLSDLKALTTAYNDLAFNDISNKVEHFRHSSYYQVMLIDIREPEEIERAAKEFGAGTILIRNPNVPQITSNAGDAGVYDYYYDYVIDNNGTLDEFKDVIWKWAVRAGLFEEES